MLARPRNFWFKFLLANWYASLIGLIVIGVDAHLLLHGKLVKWGPSAGLLAFVAATMWFSWFRSVSKLVKKLQAINASIRSLALEQDGVRIQMETGASSFVPWSSYSGWFEGKSVFLLKGRDGMSILPIDGANRETLRSLLQSRIS